MHSNGTINGTIYVEVISLLIFYHRRAILFPGPNGRYGRFIGILIFLRGVPRNRILRNRSCRIQFEDIFYVLRIKQTRKGVVKKYTQYFSVRVVSRRHFFFCWRRVVFFFLWWQIRNKPNTNELAAPYRQTLSVTMCDSEQWCTAVTGTGWLIFFFFFVFRFQFS